MRKNFVSIIIFFVLQFSINAQTITGKLIDQKGNGLSGLKLQLYIAPKVHSTISTSNGTFTFLNIDGENHNDLPFGYSVSNNFPNPFNPSTRIGFTLPNKGSVKVNIFDPIGKRINEGKDNIYPAGSNYIDLELNGLANGFYIAQIILDGKYSISKKLMLLYGSQHLFAPGNNLRKDFSNSSKGISSIQAKKIDSLVVIGSTIARKVFTYFPAMADSSVDLGSLIIDVNLGLPCPDVPTVFYEGRTYNTILIGYQCWFKENLDVGTMIGGIHQSNNQVIEKFCMSASAEACAKYGGFYEWNEAMQYKTKETSQGICPSGWHIPARIDFLELKTIVKNKANKLKRPGQGEDAGKETDESGFSALFNGYRDNSGYGNIGYAAYFWSSTEHNSLYHAYELSLEFNNNNILVTDFEKNMAMNIRCLKDEKFGGAVPSVPSLLSPVNNFEIWKTPFTLKWKASNSAEIYSIEISADSLFASFAFKETQFTDTSKLITSIRAAGKYYWRIRGVNTIGNSPYSETGCFSIPQPAPCPGTPTVTFGGKIYNTVRISYQCWLKENLDIGTMIPGTQNQTDNGVIEKYCYNDDSTECQKSGGLYLWNGAMQYKTIEKSQGICPVGWHVPTIAELADSLSAAAKNNSYALKSIEPGTNETGFSALLVGYRNDVIFKLKGSMTVFWSSTVRSTYNSYDFCLYSNNGMVGIFDSPKNYGFSIRCLKDNL